MRLKTFLFLITAGSYYDEESQGLSEQIETMRNQLGPDWLQTLEQRKKLDAEGLFDSSAAAVLPVSRTSTSPNAPHTIPGIHIYKIELNNAPHTILGIPIILACSMHHILYLVCIYI